MIMIKRLFKLSKYCFCNNWFALRLPESLPLIWNLNQEAGVIFNSDNLGNIQESLIFASHFFYLDILFPLEEWD